MFDKIALFKYPSWFKRPLASVLASGFSGTSLPIVGSGATLIKAFASICTCRSPTVHENFPSTFSDAFRYSLSTYLYVCYSKDRYSKSTNLNYSDPSYFEKKSLSKCDNSFNFLIKIMFVNLLYCKLRLYQDVRNKYS